MAAEASKPLKFTNAMRIKQGRDFSRVRQDGQRWVNGCLIANWRVLAPGAPARLGVITSSKIGNAVVRARARRLLRETFRIHQHEFAQPVDLVLVARASIAGKARAQVDRDFVSALKRGNLLQSAPPGIRLPAAGNQ